MEKLTLVALVLGIDLVWACRNSFRGVLIPARVRAESFSTISAEAPVSPRSGFDRAGATTSGG